MNDSRTRVNERDSGDDAVKSLYHCCRWCRWFNRCHNICLNPAYRGAEISYYGFTGLTESGELADKIERVLEDESYRTVDVGETLRELLETWGVDEKKLSTFETTLDGLLNQLIREDIREEMTKRVSELLRQTVTPFDSEGAYIRDPETHYCENFE